MSEWNDLRRLVGGGELRRFDRLVVLPETPSTQDAARELCGGRAGLVVIAERQTAGRGRLGRTWEQRGGLAATFVVEHAPGDGLLSLATGVASAEACEDCLGMPVWLRWPNDIVMRDSGRKLGGVLIESTGGLAFVGIGINVAQAEADWPADLRDRAVSLSALAGQGSVTGTAYALVRRLDAALATPAADIAARWKQRDCVLGTRRTFLHDGRTITGDVVTLEPSAAIGVRDERGVVHHLPAATTSLQP